VLEQVRLGKKEGILGRWSWVKVRGYDGLVLIIITVYRPVFAEGAMTAYQQQKSVLLEQGCNECPRSHLLTVLGKQIQQWID
jgi:hypothetical protein